MNDFQFIVILLLYLAIGYFTGLLMRGDADEPLLDAKQNDNFNRLGGLVLMLAALFWPLTLPIELLSRIGSWLFFKRSK